MYRWRQLHSQCCHAKSPLRRVFSTKSQIECVHVRCGSSGHVAVDLHNFSDLGEDESIVIYLPPLPETSGTQFQLPSFLRGLPVASISYRWDGFPHTTSSPALNTSTAADTNDNEAPSRQSCAPWPMPVHDTAFAYDWLSKVFAPETDEQQQQQPKRNVYVYGSFLGAGLAAGLALTQSHTHARFAVRGLIAYNGIYNWTMFLPDHRVNRPTAAAAAAANATATAAAKGRTSFTRPASPSSSSSHRGGRRHEPPPGSHLHFLQQQMPGLFGGDPAHLFDVFASPSLLFHVPGLLIPRSFTMTAAETAAIDAFADGSGDGKADLMKALTARALKPPRKSHLLYPSRDSNLRIPETLLLHDSVWTGRASSSSSSSSSSRRKVPAPAVVTGAGNSFRTQAAELAELMRRSVDCVELKRLIDWGDEEEEEEGEEGEGGGFRREMSDEAKSRVQVVGVGEGSPDLDMGAAGQEAALAWLEERDVADVGDDEAKSAES